jgi:filamentous hemagglutinin family protein
MLKLCMRPFHPQTRALLYSTALTLLTVILPAGIAHANPEGGVVSGGSATITSDANKLNIIQHSDRAIIDWRSFNIGIGEHTQFYQPNSNSVILNRVNGADPSKILGTLTANGNVILINPNGVLFGAGSRVDVNGLVATTADIGNSQFMNAGNTLHFDKAGNANASVINEGHITAKQAGLVGLVAPNVLNSGIIEAKLGQVQLASGDTVTVDMRGNGLFEVAVSEDVKSQLVSNSGIIRAEGGTIAMTAAAGKNIVNNLIKVSGELHAPTVSQKGGKIIIGAAGSNAVKNNVTTNKGQKQGSSTVIVDGTMNASGTKTAEKGGIVEITADHIQLESGSVIDASGDAGGGDIKIGGDYKGLGTTATALSVTMDTGSTILNNALTLGNGGRTILWSDDTTIFKGDIEGKGGSQGGLGGFLETSGKKNLLTRGNVILTAANGSAGNWLLDPTNITIHNRAVGGTDNVNTVSTAYLETQSVGANIDLTADNDIILHLDGDTLTAANNRNITLTATTGSITSASGGLIKTAGTGSILFNAGHDIIFAHNLDLATATGSVTLSAINNILYSGGADITTNGGNIIFNSDRNADQVGYIDINGSSLLSGGGDIIIGGGNDPYSEAARGDTVAGLTINNATINGGSGNIAIRGRSKGNANGIILKGNTAIATTSSGIIIYGYSLNGTALQISDTASISGGYTTVRLNGDVGVTANTGVKIDSTASILTTRLISIGSNTTIDISNGFSLQTTTNGNISLTAGANLLYNGGTIKTNTGTITLTATGALSVIGTDISSISSAISLTGRGTSVSPQGVKLMNSNLTTPGNITITGTGWNAATGSDAIESGHGILLSGSTLTTTGTGTITLSGTAGGTTSLYNYGVLLHNTSKLSSVNGNISVTGTGGNGTTINNGVQFSSTGTNEILSSGAGNITVTGTGGTRASAANNGIYFASATNKIASLSGTITLTGINGAGTTGYSIRNDGGATIGDSSTAGNIVIAADKVLMGTTFNITTTGNVNVKTYNNNAAINIGSGTGGLDLTSAFLNNINSGSTTIGSTSQNGDINVGNYTWAYPSSTANLTYLSNNGNIVFNGTHDVGRRHFAATTSGTGDIIIASGALVTTQGWSNPFTLTSANQIRSTGDGKIEATNGAGSLVFVAGTDINFAHDVDLVGSGANTTITLQANNSILYSGGGDITTQGGAIVLNSDRDATNAGAISLGSGTALTSNGGAITLGGGIDPTTGYAWGTNNPINNFTNGIEIKGAQLISSSGNIIVNGHGYNNSSYFSLGSWVSSSSVIRTTTGTITISGIGGTGGSGQYSQGFNVDTGAEISSSSGAISITGVGGNTSGGNNWGATINGGKIFSNTGSIDITGTGGSGSGDNSGILTSNNGQLYTTGTGSITLRGTAGSSGSGISDAYIGTTTIGDATMTGTLTYIADTLSLNNTTIVSAGSVVFRPYTIGNTIGINGAPGALQITSVLLNKITASNVTIGRNDGTGLMRVNGVDLSARNYDMTLLNGSANIQFDGGATALRLGTNNSFIATSTSGKFVTSANGTIAMNGSGNVTLSNDVILGGNLNITAGTNAYLTFGGTVNGPYDLISGSSVNNGAVIFNGAWGGISPLGNISITAWNNIVLPNIITAAGKTVDITVIGADKKITTSSIATGLLGNITLTSDDLDIGGALSGTGIVTLQPYASGRIIDINHGSAGTSYHLSTTDIGNLSNNWGRIYIGNNTTGGLRIGAVSFTDPVTFRTAGTVNLRGNFTGTDNASFTLQGVGSNVVAAQGTTLISTQGGAVTFDNIQYVMYNDPALTINTLGGNISFQSIHNNASAGNGITANSGGGNISVLGTITNGAGTGTALSYVFNAGTGNIDFGNTVNGVSDISATGTNIFFNGAWGASQGLGNVTLTSINDLVLPSITTQAGKTVTATVSGAANKITTNTISTGNIVLTADNLDITTAMTATGTATLNPYATGRAININTGPNNGTDFNLSSVELNRLTTSKLIIGSALQNGGITLDSHSWNTSASLLSNNGNITFNGAQTLSTNKLLASAVGNGDIVFGASGGITSTSTGDAIILAGRNLVNNAGSSVLTTTNGRWLVYSTTPTQNTRGGLTPNAAAIYNSTLASADPSTIGTGNRFIFSTVAGNAPSLTLNIADQTKVYGDANPELTYTLTGFIDNDTNAGNVFGVGVTTAVNGTTGVGTYNITGNFSTSLAAVLGYNTTVNNGDLVVTPKALTITAMDQIKPVGTTFLFTGTEFYSAGLINGNSISSVTFTSAGADSTATAGGGPYVITASNATGYGLSNYAITYANGSFVVTGISVPTPTTPVVNPAVLPSTVEYAITSPQPTVLALQQKTASFQFTKNDVGIEAEPALYQWLEAHPWLHKEKKTEEVTYSSNL